MKVDLDRLAPEERRLILVATDETYRALTARIDWTTVARTAIARVAFASAPLLRAAPLLLPAIGATLARSGYLGPTFARAAQELGPLRKRAFRVGEIPIPHLSPREARARFRFDHDLPEDGAAYVLDPVHDDRYVRPALVNERLAQEKLAAFLRLASALGAEEVAVTAGELARTHASGVVESPLPEIAGKLGLDVRLDAGHRVERAVVARFAAPTRPPYVPSDIERWFAIDPVLSALAETRLEGRLLEQAFSLSFDDVVDVGARACLELEGKGLDVGGRYHALTASRWSFHVRFFPVRAADER